MRSYLTNSIIVFTLICQCALFPVTGWAEVKVWEGSITVPTYEWRTDVNPKFWIMEEAPLGAVTIKNSITYPYTMQDDIFTSISDKTYRAVFLENEFLKITCLPELGGKLFTVYDKTVEKEVFWHNQVIKPSLIAMRGAGIIGGKTFNPGPQVHTTTIVSPVDVMMGTNEDGSAYIQVGDIEQMFRMQWSARVTLHPQKAYLDEKIEIFNPTDGMHPYYFWNNASLPNTEGQRFIYPMALATFHDGLEYFTWPVFTGNDTHWLKGCQGRDMSWLKNYDNWAPIFAYKCAYDFFGAYDVDAQRGLVHVADRHELAGKKAWTWGKWQYGIESQKTFTDEDGTYIEIQSGPLTTQSDYGMMMPRKGVSWQEWWYPVHGFKEGFDYATRDLAVETIKTDNSLEIRLFPTGVFKGAKCTVSSESAVLLDKEINLTPRAAQTLIVTPAPASPVDIKVKTNKGVELAVFTSPLPLPEVEPPDLPEYTEKPDEELSADEMYYKGLRFDRATDRQNARRYYKMALDKDDGHVLSLRAMAILDMEAGLYDEAIKKLKEAVRRDEGDGLAWYFLGVGYFHTRDDINAFHCAAKSLLSFGTSALGHDLIGRIYARQENYSKAISSFGKAVHLNPNDRRAQHHLLLAYYADGEIQKALKKAKQQLIEHPLDLIPRSLIALQNQDEMSEFVKDIRASVGEPEFELIESCLLFYNMGLVDEAEKVLLETCVSALPDAQRSPLPLYYLAYFTAHDSRQSLDYLHKAQTIYKDFVFPSRVEAIAILKYAIEKNPDDAYAHFHLGNLYAGLGRVDDALGHWQTTIAMNPEVSIAFRNLGLYQWRVKKDLNKAEELFRKAIIARPSDQTLYRDLAQVLMAKNEHEAAIKSINSMRVKIQKRADILLLLAECYIHEQMYSEAMALLENTIFIPWEGQTTPWDLFNEAYVKRGQEYFKKGDFQEALQDFEKALLYPENLHVGRASWSEEASAEYWRGKALLTLNRQEEARLAWEKGASGIIGSPTQNRFRQLCIEALQ